MKIICISGKAQHGKDTTASYLKDELESHGNRVLITHYGDFLKYICKTFFGWNGEKNEAGRSLLQQIGTDVIRKRDEYFWVRFMVSLIKVFDDQWDYVLIPDCRFRNEVQAIKASFPSAIHMRVVRPNFESPLTIEQQTHISETDLDDVDPDYYIWNDGDLETLKLKVNHFLRIKEI